MNKLLTIIIPTYNMEKYLDKCLSSLIVSDENMAFLEVLVINDGSKDNSSSIAHGYEKKYPETFRVIDKENGNYGSCINVGLAQATGKYVKVLDADDWFDTVAFESFLTQLKAVESDLILTDYRRVYSSGKLYDKIFGFKPGYEYTTEVMKERTFKNLLMHAVTYRLEILKSIEYQQQEGISYTDQEWVFTPMCKVEKIVYIKECVYQYLLGREGQTMSYSTIIKNYSHELLGIKRMAKVYNEKKEFLSDEVKGYLQWRLMNRLLIVYRLYLLELSPKEKRNEFVEFHNYVKSILPFFSERVKERRDPIIFLIQRWDKYRVYPNTLQRMLFRCIYRLAIKYNVL